MIQKALFSTAIICALYNKIAPALTVKIEINYTSPDTYPVYSPPNYRAASGPVTMRCVAAGATELVTYRWTSTCLVYFHLVNTSHHTVVESFLTYRDAGTHTCTVRDGNGNMGRAETTMNILGEHVKGAATSY